MGTYNIKKEERLKSLFSRPLYCITSLPLNICRNFKGDMLDKSFDTLLINLHKIMDGVRVNN